MLIKTFEIYRDFMITILYVNKSNNANEKAMAISFNGHKFKNNTQFLQVLKLPFKGPEAIPCCRSYPSLCIFQGLSQGLFSQGNPNNLGKSFKNDHTFAVFDPPPPKKMGNSMIPLQKNSKKLRRVTPILVSLTNNNSVPRSPVADIPSFHVPYDRISKL